jgi:DNA-binding NarL/FixJ family response regulator
VVIVDDDPHIHDVIAGLLMKAPDAADIQVVGQAHNGESALMLCEIAHPDLVLMDVAMPGMTSAETTFELVTRYPGIKVLVLSEYCEYNYIKAMLENGAVGYLAKDALAEDLIDAIRNAMKPSSFAPIHPFVEAFGRDLPVDFGLSELELEVLRLLAKGQTNQQVSLSLGIDQPTVRFHLSNLLYKLNAETRSESLALAAKNHLI